MKIGVISDTHIPDNSGVLPRIILEAFKGVDIIIHAGDLVDLSVLEELKKVCPNVKAVCGNMDPCEIKNILPEKEIIKVGNYKIGIMHGYGPPQKLMDILEEAFRNDGVDLVIFGHSHTGFNEKKGNILYFNPGSATDKMFSPYNSYGIIEINDRIEARIIKI